MRNCAAFSNVARMHVARALHLVGQASVGARLVDLRDNPALDDGALQPILLALATVQHRPENNLRICTHTRPHAHTHGSHVRGLSFALRLPFALAGARSWACFFSASGRVPVAHQAATRRHVGVGGEPEHGQRPRPDAERARRRVRGFGARGPGAVRGPCQERQEREREMKERAEKRQCWPH